jgi:type IV conjugative transfer system coupling protein TraD
MVVGTTGAGKTNLFNDLIPQIAARSDKAIVIDTTGDMTAKYYDPKRGDVLINPFDERGSFWDIVSECQEEYQFESLSRSIVPQNSTYSDPIWKNGSAKLLSVALQKAKVEGMTLPHLYTLLAASTLREFGYFFEGTDAFVFADPRGEKTTMSFRATLSNSIQFLKYLPIDKNPFSITSWMNDDTQKNWVFLTSNEDQLSTLRPLIAAVFDTASIALMSRPESMARRVWFILDELPALQRLQSLQGLLSKGRKYGAAVFVGLQSMSQFEKEYGALDARTILNLFNTKFFFRSSEIQTCDQISRWLGEEETLETQENLSYGAHEMRDGISLTHQKKQGCLVLPTEIAQLPDLVCYLQYPENTPIAKLKMTFRKRKNRHESFVGREAGKNIAN